MRGVSLDDIAEATKIGTRLLRALEDERFELLPGGIFNKGFVRAYAKYLGLSEDEMVADYLQAAGESAPDPRLIAEQNALRIDRSEGDPGNSRMAGFPIVPVLILLVVIAAGAGGWHIYQERMHERQAKLDATRAAAIPPPATATPADGATASPAVTGGQPEPAQSQQPAASGTSGVVTPTRGQEAKPVVDLNSASRPNEALSSATTTKPASGATPATASTVTNATTSAAPNAQSFEVTVKPKEKAWVSIKTDGKITVRGIIGPPDVKTIRANEQIVFWTGNAGAVDVTFNGQPVPLAGGVNEVAVLVITPKGATAAKPATASRTQ